MERQRATIIISLILHLKNGRLHTAIGEAIMIFISLSKRPQLERSLRKFGAVKPVDAGECGWFLHADTFHICKSHRSHDDVSGGAKPTR